MSGWAFALPFKPTAPFTRSPWRRILDAAQRSLGGARDDHFRRAFAAFQLEDALYFPARELPHHQLQWLEILYGAAAGTETCSCSMKPTAGMSVRRDHCIRPKVLRELSAAGLTIVVVEHDIAFVREVADSVSVLHYGRMFAEGTVAEITSAR